ncbi:MAG TPA: ParB/RepB/Spo0J family partition protein [bacterium]|jgi:ParB family chromosome partitioning protein|nr:ParB/RepB/Spo0J family partition protein [bacterium]
MRQAHESILELPLDLIERGFFQPREYFSPEAMEATKQSIREKGQLYPVIVRPILMGNPLFDASWPEPHYELADGERRFRCCKDLGFKTIKSLVRSLSDEQMLDHTLTTNDSLPLNPIEKATVFSRLAKEFGRSQADIAKSFNLKQQQVSEYIRLLDLPKEVQDLTARAVISVRHARELLKVQDQAKLSEIAFDIKNSAISTRELSKIVKKDKKIEISGENEPKKSILVADEPTIPHEKTNKKAIEHEKYEKIDNFYHITWFESLQKALIPRKLYQKFEYWLSFKLGSRLKPEVWLFRIELSLLSGVLFTIAGLWLAPQALLTLSGVMLCLLVYLYIAV